MNVQHKPSKLLWGATGDWELVVGLEVHAQVTSKAKPVVEVPNYTRSVAQGLQTAPKKRAIEVIAPAEADGVKGGKVKVPDPKAPKEFRTAIKVGVKDK